MLEDCARKERPIEAGSDADIVDAIFIRMTSDGTANSTFERVLKTQRFRNLDPWNSLLDGGRRTPMLSGLQTLAILDFPGPANP